MKICLCGSTRFKDRFIDLNLQLSKAGHVVYSVAGFGHSGDELSPDEKEVLDLVHLRKILESEAIFVVGPCEEPSGFPYAGESTRREIRWAEMNGKRVFTEASLKGGLIFSVDYPPRKSGSRYTFR